MKPKVAILFYTTPEQAQAIEDACHRFRIRSRSSLLRRAVNGLLRADALPDDEPGFERKRRRRRCRIGEQQGPERFDPNGRPLPDA